MYIGEVSERTGFTRDTIRFYEKKGLIKLDPRSRYPNNYKKYSASIVRRLLMIRELKEYGFTLNEIKSILEEREKDGLDCESGQVKVQEKIARIDQKIAKLRDTRRRLLISLEDCPENCWVEKNWK